MEITIEKRKYIFTKKEIETENEFIKKSWYIANLKPKNQKEFEDSERKANLWYNINTLGCNYSNQVNNIIT